MSNEKCDTIHKRAISNLVCLVITQSCMKYQYPFALTHTKPLCMLFVESKG